MFGTSWTMQQRGPISPKRCDMEQEVTVKAEPAWPLEDGVVQEGDQDQERVMVNPVKLEPELVILTDVKAETPVDEEMPQVKVDKRVSMPIAYLILNGEQNTAELHQQVPLPVTTSAGSSTWLPSSMVANNTANMNQQQQATVGQSMGQQQHQQESQNNVGQVQSILKIPEPKCSVYSNSCTQTDGPPIDYNGIYLEHNNTAVMWKNEPTAVFHAGNVQQQQQDNSSQIYKVEDHRNKAISRPSELPFCYNVNFLQKIHLDQTGSTIPVAASGTAMEGNYKFDVSQPFGYGYAIVNQMALATSTTGTSAFKCEVCGLVFTHLSLLHHHKIIHSSTNQIANNETPNPSVSNNNERQYKCDVCGVSYNLPGELRSHKRVVHKKTKHSISQVHSKCCDSCVDVGKYVKCECCQEGDSEMDINGENISDGAGQEEKKCQKCCVGDVGSTINRHAISVDKHFQCKECDAEFSRYSSLWSHKRLHSGERPFKCEICGLTFAKPAYLKNHSRVHTGEKPYGCSTCGMRFSQSPHLKNHERIHSGERPYHCQFCDKTFARHSTLWNHRRIHTGEKPYHCEVCAAAFNQATHLKNHLKVHSGEKPHRCEVCDVCFADKFTLKRHRAVHDKYKPSNSEAGETSAVSHMKEQDPLSICNMNH